MNFNFQFGEFLGESGTDWASIISSFFGALIGAGIALYVYRDGVEKQKTKEIEAQMASERSKVKYLYFLINDALASLEAVTKALAKIRVDHKRMPLVMPTLTFKPPTSLIRIANKINQEDYFHACLSQVSTANVSEIFVQFDYLGNLYNDFQVLMYKYSGEVAALLERLRDEQTNILYNTRSLIRGLHELGFGQVRQDYLQIELTNVLANFERAMEHQNPEMYHRIPDMIFIPIRELIKRDEHIPEFAELIEKINAFLRSQWILISEVERKINHYRDIEESMTIAINKINKEKGYFDEFVRRSALLPTR